MLPPSLSRCFAEEGDDAAPHAHAVAARAVNQDPANDLDAAAALAGDPNVYAAVLENRAKEVGLAVLDAGRLTLQLSQFIEPGRHYTTLLMALQATAPRDLVVLASSGHESAAAGVNKATRTYCQVRRHSPPTHRDAG